MTIYLDNAATSFPKPESVYQAMDAFARRSLGNPGRSGHQMAQASEAALEAHAQGKFWQMHDKLFQNQQALDQVNLDKYAQEVGLNMAKYKADVEAKKYKATIEAETKEGQAVGVNGTPAVFINGRKISGAYPFETFKKIADEELAKKTGKKRG